MIFIENPAKNPSLGEKSTSQFNNVQLLQVALWTYMFFGSLTSQSDFEVIKWHLMVFCGSYDEDPLKWDLKNLPNLQFVITDRMSLLSTPSSNVRSIPLTRGFFDPMNCLYGHPSPKCIFDAVPWSKWTVFVSVIRSLLRMVTRSQNRSKNFNYSN